MFATPTRASDSSYIQGIAVPQSPSVTLTVREDSETMLLCLFADDSVYLFVVNHPQHKSQVEIFHFVGENTLVHLKTITHPLLHKYVLLECQQCHTPAGASA